MAGRLRSGPVDTCVDLLSASGRSGVDRVFRWPLGDELEKLRRIAGEVVPAEAPDG